MTDPQVQALWTTQVFELLGRSFTVVDLKLDDEGRVLAVLFGCNNTGQRVCLASDPENGLVTSDVDEWYPMGLEHLPLTAEHVRFWPTEES